MTDLEVYLNSLQEGDNITVTADLLKAMEQALNEIKLYKRLFEKSMGQKVTPNMLRVYLGLPPVEEVAEVIGDKGHKVLLNDLAGKLRHKSLKVFGEETVAYHAICNIIQEIFWKYMEVDND